MHTAAPGFVPVLSSEAGLCLTAANWQEVNVNAAVYYLDSLLLKPGYELLNTVPDLAAYLNCPGTLILNASTLVANKEGIFKLVSPFDGSKIHLEYQQVVDLIARLKPQIVLLPPRILSDFPAVWEHWDAAITPFLWVGEEGLVQLTQDFGVYCTANEHVSVAEQIAPWSAHPKYVQGVLGLSELRELKESGIEFIESNQPAKAALEGMAYSAQGMINLREERVCMDFEPIDSACQCPTCVAQLTKAYLHHLYLHTPLLCQRFLIQHNAFMWGM